jgi:acetylornithine deacetylase/succinyl-diaminopimelate desuccinylase-like protein
MNEKDLSKVLERVRGLTAVLEPLREVLLANLVLIGEIPAPTFGEQKRVSFLEERFVECGLQNCSTDELGNGLAILPGTKGEETILLTAHADTPFAANEDHTYTLNSHRVLGPGVADNSLGLAVLATLPILLEKLDIQLKNNLLLMASVRNLDQGNQEGLKFFLANSKQPIHAAIVIEGSPLGRLNFRSMASLGGMITCQINRKISQESAINILCQIVAQLNAIHLPQENHTFFTLGSIGGGISYKYPARNGFLKFQLRSNCDRTIEEITGSIYNILDGIAQQPGVSAHLKQIASTKSGGLDSGHPFVLRARQILDALDISPQDSIYSPIISAFAEYQVPALCIGITHAENVNYVDEFIEIEPIMKGVAQLIGILMAIDGGHQCRTSTAG